MPRSGSYSGLSLAIVTILAVAARVGIPSGQPPAGAGQAESATPSKKGRSRAEAPQDAKAPPAYEGPWMATRHYFASHRPPPASVESGPSQTVDLKNPDDILKCTRDAACLAQLRAFFGVGNTDGVECVLAIVPDPYHTRLALFTDHSIEAIGKAASWTDWVFATQWLPWNDTVDHGAGDPAARALERSEIRAQEVQPGALVFRHGDWSHGALIVFVVGETPTAGVNPTQFQIARTYMQALWDPDKSAGVVRIAGPTFSGSFHSLARLILQDQVAQPGESYLVQSGTSQSQGDALLFRRRTGANVEFHSATENLWDQGMHFRSVLKELRIPVDRAAVLAEDQSAFGAAASRAWSDDQVLFQGAETEGSLQDVRVFRFPRDISHLREAYRQVQQAAKPDNAPVPNIDFSLKDPGVGEDSVPTYSQTQTPLSQYGVLNEITRTIRRDNIRMVEVSATNVLDLLFLAGVLRRQCPDTRLLIQSADLLFIQAARTQPLDGALFLTGYPLFSESKLWERRREIHIFADTLSEGVFNSTVLLLAEEHQRKRLLADYAWRSVRYPPAWLLTLDHGGFTPVRAWSNSATNHWFKAIRGDEATPSLAKVTAPRIWKLISNFLALCGLLAGLWILRLRHKATWIIDSRFAPRPAENSWHSFYLTLFLLILIAIQIAFFLARPFGDDRLATVAVFCGCALPAWVAIRYRGAAARGRVATRLATLAVLAALGEWAYCCFGHGSRGQLFSFRAAEMRFGSSPLWPILAVTAALLLWCFVHITRLYVAACGQPGVVTDGVEILKGRLKLSYEQFRDSVRSGLGMFTREQKSGFWIFLIALAPLCWLLRVDVQLGSIDGTPYDILCIALQLLVTVLLLITCWQIRVLWKSLHCFTTNLGLLPLARAFTEVSTAGGNRPLWVRRCNLQSLRVHTNSVLLLHDLELQPEQLAIHGLTKSQVNWWYRLYRTRIADLLSVDPTRTRAQLIAGHRRLWCLDKLVANQIWQRTLKPAWETEPLVGQAKAEAPALSEEKAEGHKEPAAPAQREALHISGNPKSVPDLAEAFVALHYAPFLLYGVRQIQNLVLFPSLGFVLLLFSMTSYSFQSPRWIGRFLLVMFVAIGWMVGSCMVQLERDPILSRIAGTKPNELSGAFYLKLVRYGALPVLGMLAWQFPSISNFLLSWLQPALEALQ